MTLAFDRDGALTIGTIRIPMTVPATTRRDEAGVLVQVGRPTPGLRFTFRIERGLDRDPNRAEVSAWNLSPDHRAAVQQEQKPAVLVEAGYAKNVQQLFLGELTFGTSRREGPDWVTTLEGGDGDSAFRGARLSQSFQPGVSLQSILEQLSEALGVGVGNALQKVREGNYREAMTAYVNGATLNGRVSDLLDKYLTTAGLEWSIQDGVLQVLRPGEATDDEAVRLEPTSGLVGAPEAGDGGSVRARSLLNGALAPGRPVEIVAQQVSGFFRVESVVHSGDTYGVEWYSDVEATPL